jgi:uncharacterized RDD family membrane protein YckC
VRLGFRLAGPGTRLGAYLIDLGIRTVAVYGITMVLAIALTPFAGAGLPMGAYFVVAFLMEWGSGCFFETWWSGQTPGKRALGLRVLKTEGYAIGFYEAMLRNLLRAADFVPAFYAAGFLTAASNPRMQRIGDLVAGTMVVRERRPELRGDLGGLKDYQPIPLGSFRHRFRPSEKTLETIEALFRRRFELAAPRIEEIASILAEPLARRLETVEDRRFARQQPAEFLFRVLRAYRIGSEEGPGAPFERTPEMATVSGGAERGLPGLGAAS